MLPRPKKRFGQHFLTDRHYLRRIVDAIAPQPGQPLVEIGPGTGLLTDELVARAGHIHVVEIDRELAAALRERWPAERLTVHESDVLEFDLASLPSPLRVAGNLPYNVSTPILFMIAAAADRIVDGTFMLQKEVVDRMVADPATGDYGRLSVMLQARFAMDKLFDVPPGAFTPPPKVDSAVVRMVPLGEDRLRPRDEDLFARLVAAAFSQRRKTLRNAVRALASPEDINAAGLDGTRRGETLSVAEFIALADVISARSSLQ